MSQPITELLLARRLLLRIRLVLFHPQSAWSVIASEPATVRSVLVRYVAPLAAIRPLCRWAGALVPGMRQDPLPWVWATIAGAAEYALSLIAVLVMAIIIDAVAPRFGGQQDRLASTKLVAYSQTAFFLSGFLALIPYAELLSMPAAGYALYTAYLGLPELKGVQRKRRLACLSIIAVSGVLLGLAFNTGLALLNERLPRSARTSDTQLVMGPNQERAFSAVVVGSSQPLIGPILAAQPRQPSGGESKLITPATLLSLIPLSYEGATRADTLSGFNATSGSRTSSAEAVFRLGDGTIHVKIADIGRPAETGGPIRGHSSSSSSSVGGYELVETENHRVTTEKVNRAGGTGELHIVLNGRIDVSAVATDVDMATVKALLAQIDMARVDALAQ